MEDNRIQAAKEWILQLANGMNPVDGTPVKDDDVVNNVQIARCLFFVADVLDGKIAVEAAGPAKKKHGKGQPFNIDAEDLAKVEVDNASGIVRLAERINKFTKEGMKPLAYLKIVNWLVAQGYLEERKMETGKTAKFPTANGSSIGISLVTRAGSHGPYEAIEYNADAQRFILDNIYAIIGE